MSSLSFPKKVQCLTCGNSMRWAALVVSALGLLVACGDGKKPATQVVAKVNKEEISVHQMNYVLQRTQGVTAETAGTVGREILERLISEELAVQKAQELKLDRNPNTVQALEFARRDVLARAYMQSVIEGIPEPTPQEVNEFYLKKPALFKERKVYTFQEIILAGDPGQIAKVQARLLASKPIAELADYLKSSGIKFSAKLFTQPAENLPLELLDQFAALLPGQAVLLPWPDGAKALILASANSEPVDELTAAPAITKFLLNDRKRVTAEAAMKALREHANVTLIANFGEQTVPIPLAAPILAREMAPHSVVAGRADLSVGGMSRDATRKVSQDLK